MTYFRAECNKRGFYPTPRGVLGGCFRCRAAKMRNCSCYEDLEAKRRNTELNDSFMATTILHDRTDKKLRGSEDGSDVGDNISNAGTQSQIWDQKPDLIRNSAYSTNSFPPKSPMDDLELILQRLKEMKDHNLIDENE